ncbi:DeoR family transcriptional regulator [Streptomyces sp. NPDC054940]
MPAPLTIAARRAMVEELLRQEPGISARNIAARLGVGKDTIRRDLDAIATAQRQTAPEPAPSEPEPAPDAPSGAQDDAPDAPPEEPAPAAEAPPADDRLTVAYDDQLRAGLATLARAGHPPDSAVRFAVAFLAHGLKRLWATGAYPPGTVPDRLAVIAPSTTRQHQPLQRALTEPEQ